MKVSFESYRNSHSFRSLTAVNACFLAPYDTVILLQIVMVSPGAHLVKNHESQCRTIESQFKNHLVPGSSCNHTVNLKTESRTLYYSLLK